jgi:hypothetical protein
MEKSKKKLDTALEELEEVRIDRLSKYEKKRIYYVLPILVFIFAFHQFFFNDSLLLSFFIMMIGIALYSYVAAVIEEQRFLYNNYYKDNIVRVFAKYINPSIFFENKRFMFNQLTQPSGLFGNIKNTTGEDYFKGKTKNGYSFQFSELKILNESKFKGTDFDGLFFIMDSPISYEKILLSPQNDVIGAVGNMLVNKLVSFWQEVGVVDLGGVHPEFEAEYRILSKKKEEAEELLNAPLLDVIHQLARQWGVKIKLSFVDKRVYLALPAAHNFFETKLEESVLTNNLAKRLYDELSLCFDAMEVLSEQLEQIRGQADVIRPNGPSQNWDNSAYDHFLDN